MSESVNSFLTPYLCGYRKGFSIQQALLSLIEKWKIVLDSVYCIRLDWCSTHGSPKSFW